MTSFWWSLGPSPLISILISRGKKWRKATNTWKWVIRPAFCCLSFKSLPQWIARTFDLLKKLFIFNFIFWNLFINWPKQFLPFLGISDLKIVTKNGKINGRTKSETLFWEMADFWSSAKNMFHSKKGIHGTAKGPPSSYFMYKLFEAKMAKFGGRNDVQNGPPPLP